MSAKLIYKSQFILHIRNTGILWVIIEGKSANHIWTASTKSIFFWIYGDQIIAAYSTK